LEEATEEARQVEITGDSAAQRDARKSAHDGSAQPDARAVHQQRGEGIGLAIVKRLSELLDATVELTSEPEQGTTFRIVLPRHYTGAQQKP
jgi:signal transduction histidine kinase